ncbi:Small ribosomal subunit protein [Trichinella spiralis]|uniref:Small ribosomal subunit protein n=1 Tax=Trichinella spiralis TaxID=6334 RepID=A0ABR3KD56_TRISP
MLKVWSADVTETVNLQLLFNLNEAEVKRATLTGWSFMLCNQILPSIGNAFSCIVKHPSQGWMTEAK